MGKTWLLSLDKSLIVRNSENIFFTREYFHFMTHGIIHVVRTQDFAKISSFNPLILTRNVRNRRQEMLLFRKTLRTY